MKLYILPILFATIFGKDVVSVDDGVSIDAEKPYNYMLNISDSAKTGDINIFSKYDSLEDERKFLEKILSLFKKHNISFESEKRVIPAVTDTSDNINQGNVSNSSHLIPKLEFDTMVQSSTSSPSSLPLENSTTITSLSELSESSSSPKIFSTSPLILAETTTTTQPPLSLLKLLSPSPQPTTQSSSTVEAVEKKLTPLTSIEMDAPLPPSTLSTKSSNSQFVSTKMMAPISSSTSQLPQFSTVKSTTALPISAEQLLSSPMIRSQSSSAMTSAMPSTTKIQLSSTESTIQTSTLSSLEIPPLFRLLLNSIPTHIKSKLISLLISQPELLIEYSELSSTESNILLSSSSQSELSPVQFMKSPENTYHNISHSLINDDSVIKIENSELPSTESNILQPPPPLSSSSSSSSSKLSPVQFMKSPEISYHKISHSFINDDSVINIENSELPSTESNILLSASPSSSQSELSPVHMKSPENSYHKISHSLMDDDSEIKIENSTNENILYSSLSSQNEPLLLHYNIELLENGFHKISHSLIDNDYFIKIENSTNKYIYESNYTD